MRQAFISESAHTIIHPLLAYTHYCTPTITHTIPYPLIHTHYYTATITHPLLHIQYYTPTITQPLVHTHYNISAIFTAEARLGRSHAADDTRYSGSWLLDASSYMVMLHDTRPRG